MIAIDHLSGFSNQLRGRPHMRQNRKRCSEDILPPPRLSMQIEPEARSFERSPCLTFMMTRRAVTGASSG